MIGAWFALSLPVQGESKTAPNYYCEHIPDDARPLFT